MAQAGSDLGVYPPNFDKYYLISYGIHGETMDLDPNKTYDYHIAYDIQPTKVVYNVDLDMNRKKILNIVPDKSRNNSAATVKIVKDRYPFTKNNVYRAIFEEFYDFSDASNYKLTMGASGITFTGINPNKTFPQMNIANVQEGGLRLRNQTLKLSLFSKRSFTICVVMQLWLNRSMSIKTEYTDVYGMPHWIYDKTTRKLKLQTTGRDDSSHIETSITVPNSFSGKRVVFWLTKMGTGILTVKASISNYSATLTQISYMAAQRNYTFKIFYAIIYKVMHTSDFHDFDSEKYHRIMMQEKLNGSYIL